MECDQVRSFLKVQGRIIIALLALLGASMASAKVSQDSSLARATAVPWKFSEPYRLPNVTVTVNAYAPNPVFSMRLPDGEVMEFSPNENINLKGLTRQELAGAAYDTRDILEGAARSVLSGVSAPVSIVQANYAIAGVVNPVWSGQDVTPFDPIAAALQGELSSPGARRPLIKERLRKFMAAIKEATYTSAIAAWKDHRNAIRSNSTPWKERGLQIGLRLEIQIGVGKHNFTRNLPMVLSLGYNRVHRTLVFRYGLRREKMEAGSAVQLGARIEFRIYQLHNFDALALDPRPNVSKVRGKTWYPPFLPILSPVLESAPGYSSHGLGFGGNIQNYFLPSTLLIDAGFAALNNVLEFDETQREYSRELPDAPEWMKQFHKKISESSAAVAISARAARCETLFAPVEHSAPDFLGW